MTLKYSDLQSILRSEKKSASLHKIPEDLIIQASELASKLDSEHKESTLKISREIHQIRTNKILRMASRTGDATPPTNMTSTEREMYAELTKLLAKHQKAALGKQETKAEKEDKQETKAEKEDKQETKAEKEEEDKDEVSVDSDAVPGGRVVVRIISPIPAIIGSDMVHYGPFGEGDEVSLPEATARILVGQGVAEEIVV